MKEILKKSVILIIAVIMVIALSGCGKTENNTDNTSNNNEGNTNTTGNETGSKTYKILSETFKGKNYIMTLEGQADLDGEGTENMKVTIAVKGDNVFVEAESDNIHQSSIVKDNKTYLLDYNEKQYMVEDGVDEDLLDIGIPMLEEDLETLNMLEYTTGKEEVEGKEYSYEKYQTDEDYMTYYFDGNDLKYIKSTDGEEEILLKVSQLSTSVEDSIFDIPQDFTEFSI